MNLDDLKSEVRCIQAPRGAAADVATLIEKLRARDKQEKRGKLAYAVAMVAMGLSLAATRGAGHIVLGAAMFLIALYFACSSLRFARVPYGAAPREFLERARRRYGWWRWQDTLAAVPLLGLLFVGGFMVVNSMAERHLEPSGVQSAQLAYVVFFAVVVACGFAFGRADWRRHNGALMEEIERLTQAGEERPTSPGD